MLMKMVKEKEGGGGGNPAICNKMDKPRGPSAK
jgi:hypothetical protein